MISSVAVIQKGSSYLDKHALDKVSVTLNFSIDLFAIIKLFDN